MTCPQCDGTGSLLAGGAPTLALHLTERQFAQFAEHARCVRCDGTGEVPDHQAAWIRRGRALRTARRLRGIGPRAEAVRRGLTPLYYLELEAGLADPAAIGWVLEEAAP